MTKQNLQNNISALLMASTAIIFPGFAFHANANEAKTFEIEEVVVTASRRTESLQNTALSVATVNPEQFAIGGLTRLSDILDYTPGVFYSGGSTPTANSITMRGISNLTAAPTVGVYIDDVPIGSGNSQAAGATLALDVMLADMERVEVIKGPQGTLYGASSMGGLMRYITRDPATDEFSGSAATDLSFTKGGGFNQKYSGRISAPIVRDKLGISVSGYYQDNSGFIDRIPAAVSGAAEDVNGFETFGVMSKLAANLSDRFTASLMVLHTETEFNGTNIVALNGTGADGGAPFVPANGPFDTDTSFSVDKSRFTLLAGTLNYEFDWGTFISSTSYQDRSVTSTTDLVVNFGPLIELFSGTGAGSVTNAPFTGGQMTERYVQEVRLVSKEGGPFEWSVGGIYSEEKSGNVQKLEGQPIDFLLLDVDIPSVLKEYAAFGNLTYYITPQVDLTAGVRLAKVKTSVEVVDGPNLLLQNTPPVTSSGTIDTYSFTARYRPLETLSLYARVASGYRPESANLPLLDAQGNNSAPPIIETDTLWSYELGTKGNLLDGLVSYDLAAWYLNWKNLQARTFVNGAMTGGNANSDVTAYGLEGNVSFYPADGLRIVTGFTYTDSTLDDDETSSFGAVAGENMPGIPKWAGSIKADYEFTLSNDMDAFIGGGVRYIGNRDTGYDGGVGAGGAVITPLIQNFVLEDHVIADINAGVTYGSVTGSLYVANLFDKYGYSGGSARPAAGFVRATANVIEPRTIGATVRVNF